MLFLLSRSHNSLTFKIECLKTKYFIWMYLNTKIFLLKLSVRKHFRYETSGFDHFCEKLIFAQVREAHDDTVLS